MIDHHELLAGHTTPSMDSALTGGYAEARPGPDVPLLWRGYMTFAHETRPRIVAFMRGAGIFLIATALAGCGQEQQQGAAPPPPIVTVAKPAKRTIVDQDEYVGRFVAVDSVEVRARVSGYLEKIHFKDGQTVKQGDPLFSIDKRPFQNTVDQARANLLQAKSNLTYAEGDLGRAQQLLRERTISEQTYEQRLQAKRNAEAAVAANEAAVRQATLDLEFTDLRAPVSGRIGDRRVSVGNLVTGGTGGSTTLLATIVSTNPIRFEFTFDEASLLRYERLAKSRGKDLASLAGSTDVKLKLLDEQDFAHSGRMDFIDNVIERTSGTIRGRAQLANDEGLFTPGMFARVRVPGSPPYEALLVPDAAIGTEQARKFVLAVGADNTAVQKYVTLGQVVDGMRVIKDGLTPDDRVIVNGLMRARPGQKVTPQEQGAAPASPNGQAKS
jgi:multidrug efflux system membrane fusion protein